MQQRKFFQNIIYCLSIFIILEMAVGCHQKVNNEVQNQPSNVELLKTTKTIVSEKSKTTSAPAVIYRSNDLGSTWAAFAKGIPTAATLSGIKQAGHKVYITTDYHGVFVISNNQDTWAALNLKQLNDLDINCMEVDGEKLVIGTLKHGIFISNDGGLNWKQSAINITNAPIRAFIKSGNKLYAGTDSGIFESIDMGNTWSHVFGQLQILGFSSLNDKIYAATQNGVLMCVDNAQNIRLAQLFKPILGQKEIYPLQAFPLEWN